MEGGEGTRSLQLLKISVSILYYLLPDEMPNYCRIFSNQIECVSKLGVLECRRSLRLETASKHFPGRNKTFCISNSGPLFSQAVLSTCTICSMKFWSKQHSRRFSAIVMEQNICICFLPFQSDKSNSDKGPLRKGRPNDSSYTSMAKITLASSSVRDVDAMSTAVDTTARSTARSSRK